MTTPASITALRQALNEVSKNDLDTMTVGELKSLEADLLAWANLAMVAAMTKRAAIREEETES